MTDWLPPTVLVHPREPWWLDASAMGLDLPALDTLPWERAFKELHQTEAGEIANPDEGRAVGHFWLRSPHDAPTVGHARAIGEALETVRSFSKAILDGREAAEDGLPFSDLLHIGIGGSALGPALLVDALPPGAGRRALRVHFIDNTDPDGIARTLEQIGERLRHTLVVIVSKSGGTVETRNAMILVRETCLSQGLEWGSRAVAITVEGSKLHQQAQQEGWRAVLPLWDWVGGRFSVTSAVGLFTAELAGIDSVALLDGAREMDAWTRAAEPERWRENPAALLAASWHHAGKGRGERAMVVLPYRDRLGLLARYLQQLIMESLGKRHDRSGRTVEQGLTVYGNKGSTDQHAYVQQLRDGRDDVFVTFLQVLDDGDGPLTEVQPGVRAGDSLQGFLLGTRRALIEQGRPSLTLTLPRLDAWQLGGVIALFERAVGLYASLIDVNAYHQPGVEAGKEAAADLLSLSGTLRGLLQDGQPRSAAELAAAANADPVEVWSILEHLVATDRLTRTGSPQAGRYRR
ncbi:MAG: glucose-6-phosphate isomerase [Deltaproteobacteria bacterium]|nr:MAG: glucose-6-phosphate isomerase [Deltaproteobacteria bacterium]